MHGTPTWTAGAQGGQRGPSGSEGVGAGQSGMISLSGGSGGLHIPTGKGTRPVSPPMIQVRGFYTKYIKVI